MHVGFHFCMSLFLGNDEDQVRLNKESHVGGRINPLALITAIESTLSSLSITLSLSDGTLVDTCLKMMTRGNPA